MNIKSCIMSSVLTFLSALILSLFPINISEIFHICKRILSYLGLRIYKRLNKARLDFCDLGVKGQPDKLGILPHATEEQLESPQSECHLTRANDDIFFYGVNSKGDFLIVNIARSIKQQAEAMLYLRLASGKEYELEKRADFQQPNANKNVFSCGGLQAYHLYPMKRWRLFYSGYLKETSKENSNFQRKAYVKFSLLWRASSDVYDSTSDLNEAQVIESVAREDWKNIVPPTFKLFKALDFYAQSGVIMGNVFVDGHTENTELYLFGERIRSLGDISLAKHVEFSHTFGYVYKNGTYIHFGEASLANIAENLQYGFVIKPSGNMRKLEKFNVSYKTQNAGFVHQIAGNIVADRKYLVCGSVLQPVSKVTNKEKTISMNLFDFFLDGNKGTGIHLKGQFTKATNRKQSEIVPPTLLPECIHPTVIEFTEELCQQAGITGGKGSSLGKLTKLSEEIQTFTVPAGLVVTTLSYRRFMNADILNEVKLLEDVLYGNKDGDIKKACKRVSNKIILAKLPNSVKDNIATALGKIFGDEYNSIRFAVRSSSTGEDIEQMSAAGQMETILGIKGLSNILSAVKKCWASQFEFTAVQYKRRYGQCLNTPMAVVIQEMVACDVAGVLFTCDPVTGNSSKMSIAANFGLGESVVSASVEPDTIELARDENDELKIQSITTGEKSKMVVLTDDGTTFVDSPEDEKKECCLSTEHILKLGNLAIKIEKCYRSKRDIEWGMKNGTVFLFQSRPVTSGTQETDFEIEHETDAALRIENDYFSVSNTAEVIPGALTPLGRDLSLKEFYIYWQDDSETDFKSEVKHRFFDYGWFTMNYHMMFSIADIFTNCKPKELSDFDRAFMLSLFGRIVDNEEIFQIAYDRYREEKKIITFSEKVKMSCKMIKNMLFSGNRLKSSKAHYDNFHIPVEKCSSSKDMFQVMLRYCGWNKEGFITHMLCTQASSCWNMNILMILLQDKQEISSDVYTDFSKLITVKGDVESADVPSAIENLAIHITKSIKPEDFKAMKVEEALLWLRNTASLAGTKFAEFLNKHGHRCVKEFDIYTATWEGDPKPLVQILQRLVGSVSATHTATNGTPSVFKQVFELKTPLNLLSRLMLLLYTPLSRRAVQGRESSKSIIVKAVAAWRKAYWRLAKQMVSEGRIPDEKILFFMTIEEIKELLDKRDPKILAKAYHRQRLYPKMNAYKFSEIMKGVPKPMNDEEEEINPESCDLMKGFPVSQGMTKGFLRVALSLDEAAHLKPGEILLAYSTDIGWSPYFPTLAGVATELGGLISHGAVVSREYGLPCVAGLHGATKRFKTGDYVLLDGNKGILQKITPPEE